MSAPTAEKRVTLQPKQQAFLSHLSATGNLVPTTIGYGGSRGGGKSAAIRYTMLQRRLENPNTTGIIIRRVYDDVKKNHIDPFFREFPSLAKYYNAGERELKLPNGSVIKFGYAETTAEVDRKFWGVEYMDMFVDQAEQFTEYELTIMKTANRWPGVSPGQCKFALFFNPGGAGTEFLRRVFHIKQYKTGERATDYAFIQAYGWDNYEWFRGEADLSPEDFYALSNEERFELFIHHTSEGRKMNALPESLRAGHLLGSFDSFAGQYFSGVWDESKVILTPFEVSSMVKPWWTKWTALDWGFAHAACNLWATKGKLSPEEAHKILGCDSEREIEVVIVYREMVRTGVAETDFALEAVNLTPEDERTQISRTFIPSDMFEKRGSGETVGKLFTEVWQRHKMPIPELVDKSAGSRVNGWRILYNGFRQATALRGAKISAEQAQQGPLIFVSASCSEVISAVPILTRDKKNPEDVEKTTAVADDVGDALRYLIKSMLDPTSKPESERRREVYEAAGEHPNDKAMAMRIYDANHKRKNWFRNRRIR